MSDSTERPSTPSLREFVERKVDARLVGLRVALPARVTSYDSKRQCVDAKPEIGQAYFEGGERIPEDLPIVTDVPLMFPGSGSFRITFPIAVGDIVLLVFASSSIARWKVTGKGGDPGDDRHHRLSDAIAIPGLISLASQPTDAPTNAIVTNGLTKLGGSDASEAVVVQAALDLFVLALTNSVNSAAMAIVANAPGKAALATLLAALTTGLAPPAPPITELATGWKAGTEKAKAK